MAYQDALRFAADGVALAQSVPSVAKRVQIVHASCAAFKTSSAREAQAWFVDPTLTARRAGMKRFFANLSD